MAGPVTGIDHVIVGVADLEAARRTYLNLGFTVTPRGRHKGWGTANYCVMFPDDYIELLGIVDTAQFTNNLDRFLADKGEGLLGLALATGDAQRAYRELTAAGVGAQPPRALGRLLELEEGTVEPRFSLVHLAAAATPGMPTFLCQHLTPSLIRRPDWLVHANGARSITSLTVAVADRGAAADAYARILDGDAIRLIEGEPEGPVSMAVGVADIEACAALLAENGVPHDRPAARSVRVPPEAAHGVDLTFLAAP